MRRLCFSLSLVWLGALAASATSAPEQETRPPAAVHANVTFKTATACIACHNGLSSASGEDVSIGSDWRGSIMANSSRDPYWQASVRRETADHPAAAAEIEDECAVCHMPMARAQAQVERRHLSVFAHLPVSERKRPEDLIAHDGVSCTMCHQISGRNLGTPESFSGGFVLDVSSAEDTPPVFGPFRIDTGRTSVMQSASGFKPLEAPHIRQSEMCATCHTLYTKAIGRDGKTIGRLPEQVPYLEWRHSAFPGEQQSCQTCHMPVVQGDTAITSVLGIPRQGLARHVFRGGNALMLRMLNRYRTELGVVALPEELEASLRWTVQQLRHETAAVAIERAELSAGRIEVDVAVRNLTGHKLPSAYPSRRAWLEVIVRDAKEQDVFHSGAVTPSGSIAGNDHDSDPLRYEPHYLQITTADQVQIYESIMVDTTGVPTTGLLRGVRYIKDNRVLPRGFDKATAHADVAVAGSASDDSDFVGGIDRVRYSVRSTGATGPFTIDVKLHFQPIGFRWAQNLKPYTAPETSRFVSYYESMSESATELLGQASVRLEKPGGPPANPATFAPRPDPHEPAGRPRRHP